jgi:hypothetical protein
MTEVANTTPGMLKSTVIGVLLSFIIVPTTLIAKLAVIGPKPHPPIFEGIFVVYMLYGSVSIALFLIVGLPMLWFMRSKKWESLMAFCMGGISVSLVGEALLIVGGVGYWDITDTRALISDTLTLSMCGLFSGAAFWALTKGGVRERV